MLRQTRTFTTSVSRRDIFDFLRRKPTAPVPAKPTKTTAEVMKEAESNSEQPSTTNAKTLRVIGLPPAKHDWKTENNGWQLTAWPVRHIAPKLKEKQVDRVLEKQYKQILAPHTQADSWVSASLSDLQLRFDFTKAVIKELGVSIPDAVQSRLETVGDIKRYYVKNVTGVQFNEKEPDALYLKPEQFGSNVTLVDVVEQRRASKARWTNVLQKAEKAEAAKQEELINKALQS